MAKVENIGGLLEKLRKRKQAAKDENCSIVVGYTAAYALFVHENIGMVLKGQLRPKARIERSSPTGGSHQRGPGYRGHFWDTGQAKFLEQPARELSGEIGRMVRENVKNGMPLPTALLLAGLFLQRESMKLVPVDTGNLRASAFTRRES